METELSGFHYSAGRLEEKRRTVLRNLYSRRSALEAQAQLHVELVVHQMKKLGWSQSEVLVLQDMILLDA